MTDVYMAGASAANYGTLAMGYGSFGSADCISTFSGHGEWAFFSGPDLLSRSVPPVIPSEQAYYWSTKWQDTERRALAALEAGDYVDFDDPEDSGDVVKWLLSDER